MNSAFEKYKDIHKGKRAFFIANGPSLAKTNLDLLENEITFAMNRVSMIYEKNNTWRPTYYFFSSTNVRPEKPWAKEWVRSVRESISNDKIVSFVAKIFKPFLDAEDEFSHINWFSGMSENKPDILGNIKESCFSKNVVERIDKTGTTMNLALQMAYHMGITELVFVGADLGWTRDTGTNSDPNHFDSSYRAEILRPEKTNNQMRNIHSLAYEVFKDKNNDIKFYNASVKTVLDVYPIIDFESYVLKNKIIFQNEKNNEAKKFWKHKPQFGYYYKDITE